MDRQQSFSREVQLNQFTVHSEELLPGQRSSHRKEEYSEEHRSPAELYSARSPEEDHQAKSIIYEQQYFPITKNPSFGAFHQEVRQPATFTSIIGGQHTSPPVTQATHLPHSVLRYHQQPTILQQAPQRIIIGGHAPIIRPVAIHREQSISKAESDRIEGLQAESDMLMQQYQHLYSLYQKQLNRKEQVIEEQPDQQSKIVNHKQEVRSSLSKHQLTAQFDQFQSQFKGRIDSVFTDRLERGRQQNQLIADSFAVGVEVHRSH